MNKMATSFSQSSLTIGCWISGGMIGREFCLQLPSHSLGCTQILCTISSANNVFVLSICLTFWNHIHEKMNKSVHTSGFTSNRPAAFHAMHIYRSTSGKTIKGKIESCWLDDHDTCACESSRSPFRLQSMVQYFLGQPSKHSSKQIKSKFSSVTSDTTT